MKPILFNTEMVRAILEGRKTVTRRVIKPQPEEKLLYIFAGSHKRDIGKWRDKSGERRWTPPFHGDDVLYVRETYGYRFNPTIVPGLAFGEYIYKAGYSEKENLYCNGEEVKVKWHPSIHMPKEAARIFLRVNRVSVERLQDITINGLQDEGVMPQGHISQYAAMDSQCYFDKFKALWDTTIKASDRDKYGWYANPWVWVIEFERISKEEAGKC